VSKFVKVLFVVGLSLVMVTPAFAGFSVYSSVRYDTFYLHTKAKDNQKNVAGDDTYTTLQNELAANARIGAKFDEGNLFGHVELGLIGYGENKVYTRLVYGVYKMDGGSLLIGQTYNPYTLFSSQVVDSDNGSIGFGCLYDSRQPQIKFTLNNGVYVALLRPHTGNIGTIQSAYLPKVAVGYNGKVQNVAFGAGVAYNGYKGKDAGFDKTVNSYLVYARAIAKLNPVEVLVQAHYGQNLGDFGIGGRSGTSAVLVGTTVKNSDDLGIMAQVGTKLAENVSANLGAGYVHAKVNDRNYDQATFYVNAPIAIAAHFHVVPEFDYFTFSKSSAATVITGGGFPIKNSYAIGAKWQMDF
jgi:hypothetical protein